MREYVLSIFNRFRSSPGVICCMSFMVFCGCSTKNVQSDYLNLLRTANPGSTSSISNTTANISGSYKRNFEKNENTKIAFALERVYFAILRDKIFEIGRISSPDTPKILMCRISGKKELNDLTNQCKNLKKLADKEMRSQFITKFEIGFKKTGISDIEQQNTLLGLIRELTVSDERERGCFLKVTEEDSQFRVYLEDAFIVGNKEEVKFRFPLSPYGGLSLLDKQGDILIGTVHSHTHDGGLSGMSPFELAEGKGDVSNVKQTKIPWIVIGPKSIEAGYLNNYGDVILENVNQQNLVIYALSKMAIKN